MHVADPAALKPLAHAVQVSLAPMLNVFSGQSSNVVRSDLGRRPAVAVEQYTAPAVVEYSPSPSHGKHAAPSEEYFPGMHSTHFFAVWSVR